MALETSITEWPVTQGQNEGQAVQVLPVGQFSSLRNARFRKQNRLGKRNGYTSKSSLDISGAALGNGNGRLSTLGPDFCVVDDRFYQRNHVADGWSLPLKPFQNGALGGTRLYGKFPEFTPAPAFEALEVQSDMDTGSVTGTALPSIGGITYAQGYVWTCCCYFNHQAGDWLIRVVATDPETGLSVFQQDVQGAATSPATVQQHPVLLSTGAGTVVLIYDHFTAGVKDGVRVVTCSSIATGFGAEVSFACIQSAANYCTFNTTDILFAYTLTGSAATLRVARMNPTTMVASASGTYPIGGAKTLLSIYGTTTGVTWAGYTDAGLWSAAFDSSLTFVAAGFDWVGVYADAVGPVMFTGLTTSTARAVAATSIGDLCVFDIDSAAVKSGRMRQFNCKALSQPFSIEGRAYIWVKHLADQQLGVATLLRIPKPDTADEYLNNAVSPYGRAWPINATVDDQDVDDPVTAGSSGPTVPTPVASNLGYVALLYKTAESIVSGSTRLVRRFLITPVRHRSEGIRYACSSVTPCAGKQFVAGAQPHWVDRAGAYEAGFIQAPTATAALIAAAGGSLTTNSGYSYTAYFESVDAQGQYERSPVAVPVSISAAAMALSTKLTVSFSILHIGSRENVRIKIFRTAANGSQFYLVGTIDATPAASVLGYVTFVDTYADSDIIQNEVVYTQVGQELPASQFPACNFANVGGNRLWCAGGFNGPTWHASKLFMPRIAPEFADDDAFRGTLPADITGSAWCDQQVFFTQEGIYVVSGDGPDGSGNGFFSTSRLPFNVGCIDPRSVAVCDLGVFFQSPRGLYLLPRGFGTPVAMDQVLDTLTTYPVITSARSDYNSLGGADTSEQIVQWTAVADEAATTGVTITFDVAYKAFYVDTCAADYPATFASGWLGDAVQSPALMTVGPNGASYWHPFRLRNNSFSDGGLPIALSATSGDFRPWGSFAHGVVNRVGMLGVLQSACTVSVTKLTDRGSRATSRGYTAVAPDYVAGEDVYLDVELGNAEQRDVTALRFTFAESSTVEGMAFLGFIIESDQKPQGFRLLKPSDRIV